MSLLIKGGTIVTTDQILLSDIRVSGEKIVDVGSLEPLPNETIINAEGKYVFPGIIDAHVHFHMNAGEIYTADNFVQGSLLAIQNGVTTIIDFAPYQIPNLRAAKSIDYRRKDAKDCYIDYKFHMEVTSYDQVKELDKSFYEQNGIKSIKIYTTYGDDMIPYADIKPLFEHAVKNELVVMIHAEDDEILRLKKEELIKNNQTDISNHAISRPREAEIKMIEYVVDLAVELGTTIYIAHVSTKEGVNYISQFKSHGNIYAETCPHYLLLDESYYERIEPERYVMSPPLRTREDSKTLWQRLSDNTLDCVSTDHCAFSLVGKAKGKSFTDVYSGVSGTETLLPVMFTRYMENGYSLIDLLQKLSTNPAKLFGMYPNKGSLEIGTDADIVIYNPNVSSILTDENVLSNSGYTIFDGFHIQGEVDVTIVRGNVLYKNKELSLSEFRGKYIY